VLNFPANHNLQPENIKIINLIGKQSPEIHNGVDREDGELGAGDQGHVWGFASNDTSVYMPLGHYIAKKIANYVSQQPFLGPDTKSQVIVSEHADGTKSVDYILVSTMHQEIGLYDLRRQIYEMILANEIGLDSDTFEKHINQNIKIDVNPCGEWRIGGSVSDGGVTGRKIVVDAFGGYARVGGGATSGKDMSKVDRSAQYACRWLAKNIVASGICDTAEVGLSYAIGVAEPCHINIELNRNQRLITSVMSFIKHYIELTPQAIIDRFNGTYPRNYIISAGDGAYGIDTEDPMLIYDLYGDRHALYDIYPWEKIDFADDLKNYIFAE
jgi:S-adenosylmethionine synthetase